jgi:hypothetical protein
LVGHLAHRSQVALHDFQGAELFFFVLDDGLGRNQLLGHARGNEDVILLGDLHATLLGVELAHAHSLAHLAEGELLGLVAGELDDIEPGDGSALLAVGLEDFGRAVEEALEALDENGTQGPCAEVEGQALVAVEHTSILAEQLEQDGKRIVDGDQRQVVVQLAGQVVDGKVAGGPRRLWERSGGKRHVMVGVGTPLALQQAFIGGVHGGEVTESK